MVAAVVRWDDGSYVLVEEDASSRELLEDGVVACLEVMVDMAGWWWVEVALVAGGFESVVVVVVVMES